MSLASLIPAALSFIGAERANASRESIADDANKFSAQQYATRYQTTVKDLTQSGLNPMLAYSQGAGSAPSGQQAQGIENSVSTAVEAHQKASQRDLMAAQVQNVHADTSLKQAQAIAAKAQADASESASRGSTAQANKATVEMVSQQNYGNEAQKALAASYWSQIQVNKATLPRIASEIVRNGADAALANARVKEAVARGEITQADVQRAINDERYERSTGGTIRQATRDIGAIAGARNQAAQADRARSIPSRRP
jgi:hypothetical protein